MKIISKYKDYYDYLVGIYGEDPKLILDRRTNDLVTLSDNTKIQLFITGNVIDGYCDGGKIFYGEDLEQFRSKFKSFYSPEKDETVVPINIGRHLILFNKEVKKDKKDLNSCFGCPIFLHQGTIYDRGPFEESITKFPKLDELNLPSFISAEKLFLMLSDWLSNEITKKENVENKQTDVEKILSKGFDKKTSFRPKIKLK